VRPDGTPEPDLAGGSSAARMSGDGRTVVFSSGATDLVPGAGAGWFLRKILSPGPLLSVGSVAIREGNSGRRLVWVPVVLSEPSAVPVTVAYATQDGTAAAPSDYAPASGTLTFAPGVTQQFAPVTVVGDLAAEQDETVHVRLSAPTVATLLVGSATLTIRDDDASAASTPGIAVGDVTADEGDREVHWLLVPVTLSVPSSTPVTVSYSTKDGSGLAGRDYTATSGTLTFPPGKTSLSVVVNVHTDSIVQGDRSFQLALSGASGEPIVHAAGTVRILDDDGPLAAGPPWQLARSIR